MALAVVSVMKMRPAVEDAPEVAEVVKMVSLTSTGLPASVKGTRSTGLGAPAALTMYKESSLRLSRTNSPAGSRVIEPGSAIWSVVSALLVTTFQTGDGFPASTDSKAVLAAWGLPEISTITGLAISA